MLVSTDPSLDMRELGQDGEAITVVLQWLMRWRDRVVEPGVLRKPIVVVDRSRNIKTGKSPGISPVRGSSLRLARHDFKAGKRDGRPQSAQHGATAEGFGRNVHRLNSLIVGLSDKWPHLDSRNMCDRTRPFRRSHMGYPFFDCSLMISPIVLRSRTFA